MNTRYKIEGISRVSLFLALMAVAALGLWAASFFLGNAVDPSQQVNVRSRREKTPGSVEKTDKNRQFRRPPRVAASRGYGERSASVRAGEEPALQEKGEQIEPDPANPDLIEDEFILSFGSKAERQRFLEMAEDEGFAVLAVSKLGNSARVRADTRDGLERLLASSGMKVKYSSNYYALTPQPLDSSPFVEQGLYTGFGANAADWLGVRRDNEKWGQGATVAVLDTAITEHPLLKHAQIERISLLSEADQNGKNAGHGTAVASLIAGRGEGFQSVVPASGILGIEVAGPEGVGDAFTLAEGIVEAADRGAEVINISLGTYGDVFILQEAVSYAVRRGSVVVAAAGNDAFDQLSFPARYEDVVAVSGVDSGGRKLPFVNEGTQMDLAAPAAAIAAAGLQDEKMLFSGTSAAAPFVSGLIAYLMAEEGVSGRDAVEILKAHSNDAGRPGADPVYGEGILNAERVLRRKQKNVYDAALSGIYVEQSGSENKFSINVAAENRGTEAVEHLKVQVSVDGVSKVYSFNSVKPGQTVIAKVPVDFSNGDSSLDITGSVDIPGHDDIDTRNNMRRSVMLPVTE